MTQHIPDDQLHLRYAVDLHIDTKGEDPAAVAQRINASLTNAVDDADVLGQFDGCEIKVRNLTLAVMGPEAANLDEEMISKWLSIRIEGGDLLLEDIPRVMASYALADPVAIREEIAERIAQGEYEPALRLRGG